jgi:hypothetical protein
LRAELAEGRGWEWLDPRVADYVRARGLYGSRGAAVARGGGNG